MRCHALPRRRRVLPKRLAPRPTAAAAAKPLAGTRATPTALQVTRGLRAVSYVGLGGRKRSDLVAAQGWVAGQQINIGWFVSPPDKLA